MLADSGFLVLALLAESRAHGYEIQRLARNRGFQFWTKLQRSSIYNALVSLEAEGLISAHVEAGGGPDRKVYEITEAGRARLHEDGIHHLKAPAHPRSELDLGIYALPFLSRGDAKAALARCIEGLTQRKAFLEERLEWCRARELWIPALAFERPLLALRAEIEWLERVAIEYEARRIKPDEWAKYIYREPPGAEVDASQPATKKRKGRS